jgi:Fe-S-cluster containining protein
MGICDSCHAGCCRSFAVPLCGADIVRIQRDLGVPFWDFVCRWADPQGLIAGRYAPHFYFADEPETPFVICLLHRESELHPETSKCRFLMEGPPEEGSPEGRARCGIYHSRPSACRAFPARLNHDGTQVQIESIPARGREGSNPLYQLCPRPWEPEDFNTVKTVQDLVVARDEMAFFHRLAERWNLKRHPWELFPDFLQIVYEQRVVGGDDDDFRRTIPITHAA